MMKSKPSASVAVRNSLARGTCALLCILSAADAMDLGDLQVGAAGWMQYGMVANSTDTAGGYDFNGRSLISSGAQIALRPSISENLSIAAGVGVALGHSLPGRMENLFAGGYAPTGLAPYVAEASFSYSFIRKETSSLVLRGGLFPYDYASENQNLGLYLLRGPVYPGLILSGFETKHVLPVANTLGAHLHHQVGRFHHDLLLLVETDFYPFYDLSPAYIATYGAGSAFRLGAGVNFYHLIPMDRELLKDGSFPTMNYVDTTDGGSDTTRLTFQGMKFMANIAMDPKALVGDFGILGAEDLKIYGEVALIGLPSDLPKDQAVYLDSAGNPTGETVGFKREKVYKLLYGDTFRRMPVMFGFNFPAFRLLDRLAFEVEWYGAPFKDDLASYNHFRGNHPTPRPLAPQDTNYSRDNWKWSLYGSRMLNRHIKLSFQAASDHYRPGIWLGYGDNKPPGSQVIFRGPSEWYWMTKIAYFF